MPCTAIAFFFLFQPLNPLNVTMRKTEFLFRLKIRKLETELFSNSLTAMALNTDAGSNVFNQAVPIQECQ